MTTSDITVQSVIYNSLMKNIYRTKLRLLSSQILFLSDYKQEIFELTVVFQTKLYSEYMLNKFPALNYHYR